MQSELSRYGKLIREFLFTNYKKCLREPGYPFDYPFIVPGSESYSDELWDWDSWLNNIAIRQVVSELGDPANAKAVLPYEQGCILNFLSWHRHANGWLPIAVLRGDDPYKNQPTDLYSTNMHKPVLAQHAAFLVRCDQGNAEWLRSKFEAMMQFVNHYLGHYRHRCGLFFWQDDRAIGVDNDPCTYSRPPRSTGSIYLNCLMYKELEALVYLCKCLNLEESSLMYQRCAAELKEAINTHCWDERDGFYYSVDLNLLPNDNVVGLHQGMPRYWECLIMRIGVWTGFMGLWAKIANQRQAERIVNEHFKNTATFNSPYGIRSLSKTEKMYSVWASGNPSNWLGPIWGIVNYMTFRGLIHYGFTNEAKDLAEKTVRLFGRDLERFGAFHEYYQPENGEPVMNRGFQSWNNLVINMLAWLEGKPVVEEF